MVGYAYTNGTATDEQAFIWTYGAASSTSLYNYASGLSATNLSGWNFQYAEGVNNSGEVVGYGTLNGVGHAFALLNYPVPEPLTLVLLAAGLFGLLAYAWRKRR